MPHIHFFSCFYILFLNVVGVRCLLSSRGSEFRPLVRRLADLAVIIALLVSRDENLLNSFSRVNGFLVCLPDEPHLVLC